MNGEDGGGAGPCAGAIHYMEERSCSSSCLCTGETRPVADPRDRARRLADDFTEEACLDLDGELAKPVWEEMLPPPLAEMRCIIGELLELLETLARQRNWERGRHFGLSLSHGGSRGGSPALLRSPCALLRRARRASCGALPCSCDFMSYLQS